MNDLTETRLPYVTPGWGFVNLFYDRNKRLFYCRIHKIDVSTTQNQWVELTASGATMLIALHNVKQSAESYDNAQDHG